MKPMKVKTSILIDSEIYKRILEQIEHNKRVMRGPTTVGRLIEYMFESYLETEGDSGLEDPGDAWF